jgi:hypothetical protein
MIAPAALGRRGACTRSYAKGEPQVMAPHAGIGLPMIGTNSAATDFTEAVSGYADVLGALLIVIGVGFIFAGSRVMRPLIAVSAFVPSAWSTYELTTGLGRQDAEIAAIAALLVGVLTGTIAAIMYDRLHMILGGIVALGAWVLFASFFEPFLPDDLFWGWTPLVLAIGADIFFLIGMRMARHQKEMVSYLAPSVVGGLSITLGVALVRVGISGWEVWEPFGFESALVLFISIGAGIAIQQYIFDEEDSPFQNDQGKQGA